MKTRKYSGEYNNDFGNSSDLTFSYEYDRSNRLLEAVTQDNKFEITNSYDKDGNILTLDRKGSAGSSVDDFNYSYYNGTNKISRVQSTKDQFVYDYNGNLITDSLNSNFSIHYDHRNLITDLIQRVILVSGITPADTSYYKTYYNYDEAGNRIRKKIYNDENDSLLNDIIYSRNVSGKEMAIYENGSLKQWNIWGLDNAGFLNANGDKRFYLKDHLGSVRAVLDEFETVISSQDYDAWGYQLQNRSYNSEESIYKFTSKEHDEENKYDYFGARYYDARIGRWGSVEPLLDKYITLSPYQYSLLNPLKMIDVNGEDAKVTIEGNKINIDVKIYFSMDNKNLGSFNNEYSQNLLSNYLQEAQNQWQDAFSQISDYDIEFNIIPEFVSSTELNEINSNMDLGISNSGENVAGYFPNEKNPGVDQNYLRIVSMEGKTAPPYTGSHEIGHLIGLEHPYPTNSKAQKASKNIMGYNNDRSKPTVYDAFRFFNKLDLGKQNQIIKGAYNVEK